MENLIKDNEKKQHEHFMRMASNLASRSVTRGCGPFGCVIINTDTKEIIGSGHNQVLLFKDPTLHAEMVAIKDACHNKDSHILDDCILYSSCEPCPMCYAAICWARIPIVYYGNTREDASEIGFDDSLFYEELKKPLFERQIKMNPCLQNECSTVFKEWKQLNGNLY